MGGWEEWAQNMDMLQSVYQRPGNARGMVTDAELCLAETYARHSYRGEGKIVELGCWLGAVTLALARGASDNCQVRWARPIHSYDRFRWEGWMTPIAERLGCPSVQEGESFLEHTKAAIKLYENLICLHEEDLRAAEPFPDPIEFLFIDAMKSWELANAIVRAYFPRLIGQRSIIVQQDFAYFEPVVATNHILMWLLREYAVPVYHVPKSCSVAFFVRQSFDGRELPVLSPGNVTIEMAEQAWAYSMACVRSESVRDVWLCKILFFIEQMWLEAAWEQAQLLVNTIGPLIGPAAQEMRDVVTRISYRGILQRDYVALVQMEKLLCGERPI